MSNKALMLQDSEKVEGTQNLTARDLAIPVVTVVQGTHRNIPDHNKHVGELYNSLTGEFKSSINAVPVNVNLSRAAFDRTFDAEAKPVCRSADAEMPLPEYVGKEVYDSRTETRTVIGAPCIDCPLSQWGSDGTPPMCGMNYTYGFVDADEELPFLMRFQRTAVPIARKLNMLSASKGRRKVISITTTEQKDNKGNYFIPSIRVTGDASPEVVDTASRVAAVLSNLALRKAVEDEEIKVVGSSD